MDSKFDQEVITQTEQAGPDTDLRGSRSFNQRKCMKTKWNSTLGLRVS